MSTKTVDQARKAIDARNQQMAKLRKLTDRLQVERERYDKLATKAWASLPENCAISFENCNSEVNWELVVR